MSHLDHPNVLRALGISLGGDGEVTALLMPSFGSNLQTWIEGRQPAKLASTVVEQPLRWAERACLIQVASGLAHVHARGIVHLDVKPENILVQGQHFAIADFGCCRTTGPCDPSVSGITHGMLPANRVNSAQYRPLELFELNCRSVQPSPRSDLWAFSCVAFEATAWMSPIWRRPGHLRRLFDGLDQSNRSSAQQWCDDRIKRHSPRVLAPILLDAMRAWSRDRKYVRASEMVLKLEALASVAEYVDHAVAEPHRPASADAEP